ncbi:MAG: T9SS type A sorting domain-containing protein, partial [Bacteroidetes bacterium]|nr:T9SS type A sorting domain-containing protein [Bacteroidota bacterium]
SDLFNILQSGVSIFNYTGHGTSNACTTTGLNSGDVDALTNVDLYPFIWSVACVNGDFVNGTCFAEKWLRATDNTSGEPTGAIATLMSTINQSWTPPMSGQDEMNDILVESYLNNIKRSYGGLSLNGCMQMNDDYGAQGAEMTDTWCLFGDPSVVVRTAVPGIMTVTHNATIVLGGSQAQIQCNEEDAYVSLTLNGEIMGTGFINGGSTTINFPGITTVDTITVTVTGFNMMPYFGDIVIIVPTGPYVLKKSIDIDDGNGNNDQLADYGELVNLDVSLENVGIAPASGVIATISSSDLYITITDDTHSWGTIPDGSTSIMNSAFEIKLADYLPDQHVVAFDLVITDNNSNTWNSTFNITLNAPILITNEIVIDDSIGGNGNGIMEDGETVDIIITTENIGNSDAPSASGTLSTADVHLTISTNPVSAGIISKGTSKDLVFAGVMVGQSVPMGTIAELNFVLDAADYSVQTDFLEVINQLIEDFETNDFSKFSWSDDGDLPWETTTVDPYEGSYCGVSGAIGDNEKSVLLIQLNVVSNDDVSFFKKVGSESGYDFLRFYIDGVLQGQWSGLVDWSKEIYPVIAGDRVFKWIYKKDGFFSENDDAAYLDEIILPPAFMPVLITLNGQVVELGNGEPINNAGIIITNDAETYEMTTNSSGNFSIGNFPTGTYEVYAAKWGHSTECVELQIDEQIGPLAFELNKKYQDDFVFDFGWSVTGNADKGIWERGVPIGTTLNSQNANPGEDIQTDCGEKAMITGNGGGSAGTDDVDNGSTILTSPEFDATIFSDPYISYYRWWFNQGGPTTPDDAMAIYISDGNETKEVERLFGGDSDDLWKQHSFRISDIITPSTKMKVIFEATDAIGAGNIVEAGIDNFLVYDNNPPFGINETNLSGLAVYPNPFDNELMIRIGPSSSNTTVRLFIYNIYGQLVFESEVISGLNHVSLKDDLPAGMYILSVIESSNTKSIKLIKN